MTWTCSNCGFTLNLAADDKRCRLCCNPHYWLDPHWYGLLALWLLTFSALVVALLFP